MRAAPFNQMTPRATCRGSRAPAERRHRICMVTDDFMPAATGVGHHVQMIASDLALRGHSLSVITTRRRGEPAMERLGSISIYRAPSVRLFGFDQALATPRWLRATMDIIEPTVIHHHYVSVLLLQSLSEAHRRSIPSVLTFHMTADHLTQPRVLRPLAPLAERLIVRQSNLCDAVVVPSERLADELPGRGVTAPCHFVRNPVAFEGAPAAPVPRDDRRFVVLFAGRLDEEKNVSLLLRAFAALSPDRGSTELWIAGRGRQRRLLERLARELGIAHLVRFLGFLEHEELAKRYAAADVFVLPSRVETHGMVVVEAMRFGTPAIVTDRIVSARELVEHGRDGYVVADDPAALSRALERLRADPSLRAQLGRRAAESARAYSVEASVDALEAIYGALPSSSGEREAA